MPSTAKRFMRVDGVVDQRLDPYSATEAAANLMLCNYRLLGSWPLAVTAYNHGPGGLRRAQDELGTTNIAVIVKRYQGATFGFASRNFYVAFLAALEVDRNAEKYFGPLTHPPDTQSTVVTMPDYVPVDALARAFKADLGALRVLNPALRPPVWNNTRFVPRGYALRIPGAPPPADIAAAWARLAPAERFVAQRNDGAHRARRGETLAGIPLAYTPPTPPSGRTAAAARRAAAPGRNTGPQGGRSRRSGAIIIGSCRKPFLPPTESPARKTMWLKRENRFGSSRNNTRICRYGWWPNTTPMWILAT